MQCSVECICSLFVCNETVVFHNVLYQTKPDKQALTHLPTA